MEQKLSGKTIAILVTDGFEQVELTEPKKAMERKG
jgi:protease I